MKAQIINKTNTCTKFEYRSAYIRKDGVIVVYLGEVPGKPNQFTGFCLFDEYKTVNQGLAFPFVKEEFVKFTGEVKLEF